MSTHTTSALQICLPQSPPSSFDCQKETAILWKAHSKFILYLLEWLLHFTVHLSLWLEQHLCALQRCQTQFIKTLFIETSSLTVETSVWWNKICELRCTAEEDDVINKVMQPLTSASIYYEMVCPFPTWMESKLDVVVTCYLFCIIKRLCHPDLKNAHYYPVRSAHADSLCFVCQSFEISVCGGSKWNFKFSTAKWSHCETIHQNYFLSNKLTLFTACTVVYHWGHCLCKRVVTVDSLKALFIDSFGHFRVSEQSENIMVTYLRF